MAGRRAFRAVRPLGGRGPPRGGGSGLSTEPPTRPSPEDFRPRAQRGLGGWPGRLDPSGDLRSAPAPKARRAFGRTEQAPKSTRLGPPNPEKPSAARGRAKPTKHRAFGAVAGCLRGRSVSSAGDFPALGRGEGAPENSGADPDTGGAAEETAEFGRKATELFAVGRLRFWAALRSPGAAGVAASLWGSASGG